MSRQLYTNFTRPRRRDTHPTPHTTHTTRASDPVESSNTINVARGKTRKREKDDKNTNEGREPSEKSFSRQQVLLDHRKPVCAITQAKENKNLQLNQTHFFFCVCYGKKMEGKRERKEDESWEKRKPLQGMSDGKKNKSKTKAQRW